MQHEKAEPIRIFLCGDVMTGRGIDQALPHPGNPVLHESYVRDAREYVRLAEAANGPIERPLSFASIWGDALEALDRSGPDVRIINLETSVTSSEDAWRGKGIHYHMNPQNIGCLTAAQIDCCCLANNHVLDWGYGGLRETLAALDHAGITRAGAGANATEARAPATIEVRGKGRVLVFSMASTTGGTPAEWAATGDRPGVNLLKDLSVETARRVADEIRDAKRPGDVAVTSIHWGANWGYDVPSEQIRFAHLLVEEGVDIVHGHSSHHVKAIEPYRNGLILYGCGDFLNDYEGIRGYENFRADLRLMYLVTVDPHHGRGREGSGLLETRLVPMQVRRFRLNHASQAEASWLCDLLNRLGAPFATELQLEGDNSTTLRLRYR